MTWFRGDAGPAEDDAGGRHWWALRICPLLGVALCAACGSGAVSGGIPDATSRAPDGGVDAGVVDALVTPDGGSNGVDATPLAVDARPADAAPPPVDAAPPPVDAPPAPAIVDLQISPASASVPDGMSVGFEASFVLDDATVVPATDVTWSSSAATVAQIDAAGTATALSPGNTTIGAASSGFSATAALAVTDAIITGAFVVSPADATVQQGQFVVYVAQATYSDGTTKQVTAVDWLSSAPSVATIDAVTGVAGAQAPGTTIITGTASGTTFSSSTSLTVATAPPPPGEVGAACSSTPDCDTAAGLTCQADPALWPGGYCTKDCTTDHYSCPVGSSCYPVGAQGASWFCVQNCTPDPDPAVTIQSSCRADYCCFSDPGSGAGGCFASNGTVCL